MADITKAKVSMSGEEQRVTIPLQYRFTAEEVYVSRDPKSGDIILAEAPPSWEELFAALDASGFPKDFMDDREQGTVDVREDF